MRAGVCRAQVLRWLGPFALGLTLASAAPAQEPGPAPDPLGTPAVLTLDQDRLFAESAFGRASLDRERLATRALEEENARIEAELIAEEQDLTTRRALLPAEEFAALAAAFDEKVERIRDEQDAKARNLSRGRDDDRQAFLRAVVPVLGDLLSEKKAVAILDKSMVILSLIAIDITDEAITRVDSVLSEGTLVPDQP
ncbi:OmpH family outer membrane protein [Tabrizicola sp.]|uniref:OmpH family outer membrane protein n=1 Tax=Tabrizicola sp. TaxID=2005166 RepID=UPI00262137D7|nr:OmpH family outer membrane protein [Tabrizicola sp.]MDM7930800.1 OmpH family outer membrane protein [Tabrizicola sp.]